MFFVFIFICPALLFAHQEIHHLSDEEIEASLLRKFSNITRSNWVLEIKTPESVVTFKDARDLEEGYRRFFLIGSIRVKGDRRDYLIHLHGYEGHSYVLVNSLTGEQIHVFGIPNSIARFRPLCCHLTRHWCWLYTEHDTDSESQ